jgi:undecaprenyl phosphate-alpha-L-ara4FN deformylase
LSLALKIDVDTYRGLAEGTDQLVEFLHAKKIPATFFVTLGPDTSGWAATRVFRHRGFLKKMNRTSALSLYGWRTALSGTFWPARPMGSSFKDTLRRLRENGFEVSPHGYDHIRWHDQAADWNAARAAKEWTLLSDLYTHIFNEPPRSFAAPGWQAGEGTWSAMDDASLLYHSDSRGTHPYFPATETHVFHTLEIPTTLATWDEMLAWPSTDLQQDTLKQIVPDQLNVWTLHAEFEGGPYFELFRKTIEALERRGESWIDLRDAAATLLRQRDAISVCRFKQTTRPGRAGTVTAQAPELPVREVSRRFGEAEPDQARA